MKGKRYQVQLDLVGREGNSKTRIVVFKDVNCLIFKWYTRDSSKAYTDLKPKAKYKFTVSDVFSNMVRVRNLTVFNYI